MVEADRDLVFLNPNEYAEMAIIDGREVRVSFDTDMVTNASDAEALERSEVERLMFIKVEDLNREPNYNDQIMINGKPWFVKSCRPNMGIYEIRISRERIHD